MSEFPLLFSDREILAARPAKNRVDPFRPYAFLVEPERTAEGRIEDVATIFLTSRECPFRCLMCDLWKNTTDICLPEGAIPKQIDFALSWLPPARHVKLYNSGNFFDTQAIPHRDHADIAERVRCFQTVIVENHPRLCSEDCLRFRDLLRTNLEIAIGLETANPDVLPRLNKQMTTDDFHTAVRFLRKHGIAVRAFVLLKPPFQSQSGCVGWAVRSLEFAFSAGVGCCSVIPTRAGNGIMERLQKTGDFAPPGLSSMEQVLQAGILLRKGRVFMDLWDAEQFFDCTRCSPVRVERLRRMNLSQQLLPAVECDCGSCG